MESEHASQAAPRRQRELERSHDADANQSLAGGEGRGAAGGGGTHRASARRDRRSQTPSPCPSARACPSTKPPSSRSRLAATTSSQKQSASGTCHSRSGTPGHTASVWISNQKGHWEGIHWTRTPSSREHSGSCVRPRPEIRRAARQACNARVAHARVARRTSAQPLRRRRSWTRRRGHPCTEGWLPGAALRPPSAACRQATDPLSGPGRTLIARPSNEGGAFSYW